MQYKLGPRVRGPSRPCARSSVVAGAGSPSVEEVSAALQDASSSNREAAADARAFRRQLNKLETYTRRTFDDAASLEKMEDDGVGYSRTGLVAQGGCRLARQASTDASSAEQRRVQMRATGKVFTHANVTVKLAEAYGFCWGVERAVQMAYEARQRYPDRKLYITNEIIHNPGVNRRMTEMDVNFIEVNDGVKDFSPVASGDVVILPAFGASVQEMRDLNARGVQIVDTTCPWVAKVWNAVDKQATKQHTSIIHGKYSHEETVATASFAGDYLIVKNMAEAEYVSDYILNGGDREEFRTKFEKAGTPAPLPSNMQFVLRHRTVKEELVEVLCVYNFASTIVACRDALGSGISSTTSHSASD